MWGRVSDVDLIRGDTGGVLPFSSFLSIQIPCGRDRCSVRVTQSFPKEGRYELECDGQIRYSRQSINTQPRQRRPPFFAEAILLVDQSSGIPEA